MHAIATSPDDLISLGLYRSSVSSKARRYPDFIRKNSRNPNEFAQFAFNLLMLPDDDASLALRMTREGAPLSRLRNPPASPI